jgi:hypothetical protein
MRVYIFFIILLILLLSCNYGNKQDAGNATTGIQLSSQNADDPSRSTSEFELKGKRELNLERDPAVCDYAKYYPCDVSLQSDIWSTLTVQERMLAKGYELVDNDGVSFSPKKEINPVRALAGMIACYYNVHGKMPESTDEIWKCIEDMLVKQDSLDRPVSEVKKEFYDSIISPVTGKVIEWNKESFSRGNAFVTVMNDNQEAIAEAEERYGKLAEMMPPRPEGATLPKKIQKKIHVMARIYGETGMLDSFVMVFEY